jgi:phenylpropionate dioxygenase-like ring-hydroxylating dioxygenase large terminal subunit
VFLQNNSAKTNSDFPAGTDIRESDWHILASFWHPVAVARDVGNEPCKQALLDVNLVIFRTASGVTVALDRCPHRGARLSDGTIENDRILCPMHGLNYDAEGVCTRIPCIADAKAPIPQKLCLKVYESVERYGLIWTCLKDEPARPLPEWPELEDPALKRVNLPTDEWAASAGRHVENFNDFAHLPWVHLKSFGGTTTYPIPTYSVEQTDYGLTFGIEYEEGGNRFPDGVDKENRMVDCTHELTYPFSTLLKVAPQGSDFVHYFADTVCPVSANRSRIFQCYTDTTGDPDVKIWSDEAVIINGEDKLLVEGQSPGDLPLDLTEEISIPADRASMEYRKGLVKHFRLGAPD